MSAAIDSDEPTMGRRSDWLRQRPAGQGEGGDEHDRRDPRQRLAVVVPQIRRVDDRRQGHQQPQRRERQQGATAHEPGAALDLAFSAQHEPCRALHQEHGHAGQAHGQAERVKQSEQSVAVLAVDERQTARHVAEGHAQQQRGQQRAEEEHGVPDTKPARDR